MSYHSLSECTLTDDERQQEAERILTIITSTGAMSRLSLVDVDFLSTVCLNDYQVSTKQLFWLRDLKDKVMM
jgi:hypothetical protein